jgi:predicted nucleic acid-binding protein
VFENDALAYESGGTAAEEFAHLAAIAIEHGLEVCSADSDFARFAEIRWRNPVAA